MPAKSYVPSWLKNEEAAAAAAAAAAATALPPPSVAAHIPTPTLPPAPPHHHVSPPYAPLAGKFGVTQTTTNRQSAAPPTPHFSTEYNRPPSGSVSPSMGTRLPTRFRSPAMMMSNTPSSSTMNASAPSFHPKVLAPLPSSTAAAAASAAAATPATAATPASDRQSYASASTSLRDLLKNYKTYVPRRTMNRLLLTEGSVEVVEGEEGAAGGNLRDTWRLHYLPRGDRWAGKNDAFDPMLVATMSTIPSFWRVFNNLPTPRKKKTGTYYLFRDDIDPKWEHVSNQGGGVLRVLVSDQRVDAIWELLILRAIGGLWTKEIRLLVNGVAVKMRDSSFVLEIWVTGDSEDLRRDLEQLWGSAEGGTGWFEFSYTSNEQSITARSKPKHGKDSTKKRKG